MKALLTLCLKSDTGAAFQDAVAVVDEYNERQCPVDTPPGSFDNFKSYALYRQKKFGEVSNIGRLLVAHLFTI